MRSLKELEDTAEHSLKQKRSEYKKWAESHGRYIQQPPSGAAQGRAYIQHAQTLLDFLDPISEMQPILKGVVAIFKAVVLYEVERGENDTRVSCLFLAQSHMMDVIIRIYHGSDDGSERDTSWVGDIVGKIEGEIRLSGNTVDSYYKSKRMVRFLCAMEWKARLLQHVEAFNALRKDMHDHLSLSAAEDLRSLHKSLNKVITTLANPQRPWEKTVAGLDKSPGREQWLNKDDILRDVLLEMGKEDTSDDYKRVFSHDGETSVKDQQSAKDALEAARRDIQTTVVQICTQNEELFDRKLEFFAARLKNAIDNSAKMIVQALDGPHSRLENEDLRKLWKEMKWMFCVESRTFVNSLFEFYRDKFTEIASEKVQDVANPDTTQESPERRPIHPDAWTLKFLAESSHISVIALAFDQDKSGFVRITEANTFTRLIPPNFTLAQWCAFEASGRELEGRIYQLRIQRLLLLMTEMQNRVLRENIVSFADFFDDMVDVVQRIVDSVSFQLASYIPPELESLVKQKIFDQDEQLRKDLSTLLFDLDGENTVRLIFGKDVQPETYLLRLLLALLEHWASIEYVATVEILDGREWKRLRETHATIRGLVFNRIVDIIQGDGAIEIASIHKIYNGIYYYFLQAFILPVEYRTDVKDDFDESTYFEDLTLINAFPPLVNPQQDLRQLLRYPTYSEFHETNSTAMEADTAVEWGWGLSEEEQVKYKEEIREIGPPPHHFHVCDICHAWPIVEQAVYRCYRCEENQVFCETCYKDGKHVHDPTHVLLKTTTFVPEPLYRWLNRLGLYKVLVTLRCAAGYDYMATCNECKEEIKEGEMVAQCVGDFSVCPDYHRCIKCFDKFDDETAIHKSWHHVMIIPEMTHSLLDVLNAALYESPATAEEVLTRKVVDMEDRLNTLEGKLDEGMKAIQEKMANLDGGMKTIQERMDKLLGYLEGKFGEAE